MAVDYTPSFDPADVDSDYGSTGGDITVPTFTANMKPFRFWCQKALPLVYDDSLSYYEVLCKVVDQMNGFLTDLQTATGSIGEFAQQFVVNQQFLNDMAAKLGQNVDTLETYINDRMDDFTAAYQQLQSYVNNYFDNLDVQQEINNKLDAMAADGTFNALFNPVITAWMTAKTAQIDSAIANQDAIQAQQNGRISVLEGRMDGFASLPSGATSGNAELLDIRTNFLGETYPSAGDAVRSSDMIASGFQSIGFTRLTDWNGNEESSVYDTIVFDVAAYKGGHASVIANMENFRQAITDGIGISLYGSNVAGKTVDNNAQQYPFPDGWSGFTSPVFKNYSVISTAIQGEERVLLQLSIPNDFPFQYLKLGNVEIIPQTTHTTPEAIVYANSWSKTPVDATLSIAGYAADAKATGDAFAAVNNTLNVIETLTQESISITSAGVTELALNVGDIVDIDIASINGTANIYIDGYSSSNVLAVNRAGQFTYTAANKGYLRVYFLDATSISATATLRNAFVTRITGIEDELEEQQTDFNYYMFENVSIYTESGDYETPTGGKINNSARCRTEYISDNIETITFNTSCSCYIYAYNRSNNAYAGTYSGNGFTTNWQEKVSVSSPFSMRTLRTTYPNYKFKLSFFMTGGSATTENINLIGSSSVTKVLMENKTKVYTVGTGRDFETFTAMLVALQGDESKKIVYVESGIYNIFEEIGGAEYMATVDTNKNWRDVSNIVPPNTEIVGIGDVVLYWNPTDTEIIDQAHAFLFSPLNISGNCTIKNITIECSNCRYAIHDETSGKAEFDGIEHVFENVVAFYHASTYGGKYCYGAGHNKNSKYKFRNCTFSAAYGVPWSIHDWPIGLHETSLFEFDNCVFLDSSANSTGGIRFSSSATDNRLDKVIINGCVFSGITFGAESGTSPIKQGYTVQTNLCKAYNTIYTTRLPEADRIAPTNYNVLP